MIDNIGFFKQKITPLQLPRQEVIVKVKCRDCGEPMGNLESHRPTYPHLFVCYNCDNGCEIELEFTEMPKTREKYVVR